MKTTRTKTPRKTKKKAIALSKKRYDKACMYVAKLIVHARDKEVCQRCWKTSNLQCSHILSDGRDTRMSVMSDNMKLLCYNCHLSRWHKEPTETKDWMEIWKPWLLQKLKDQKLSHEKWTIHISRREKRLNDLIAEYKTYWKNITMDDLLLIKFK